MNVEKIRRDVVLIGKAIDNHDELVTNIVEAHWRHDMISTLPELGMATDPRSGQAHIISPADMRNNIAALEKQREAAEQVAVKLTGATDMDGARKVYLNVLSAFQRLGQLREMDRLGEVGLADAEISKQYGLRRFPSDIAESFAILQREAAGLNTELSTIERLPTGLVVPS